MQRLASSEVSKQNGHCFAGSVSCSRREADIYLDTKETYLHKELFDEADVEIELVGQSKQGLKTGKNFARQYRHGQTVHTNIKETSVPFIVSIDRVERVAF